MALTCDLPITSTIKCPSQPTYKACKNGKSYATYCDEHAENLTFLWKQYDMPITLRELEGVSDGSS